MDLKVPNKFRPLYEPSRYKVYYGGRGGRKSWEVAQALSIQGCQRKLLIVCGRELQNSIDDSVHKLLCDTILRLNLIHFYDITDKKITGRNGTKFIFKGLRNNIAAIKSLEGADILWVEEAANVSYETWETVIPTVRKPGSEIWATFNPQDEMDDTYQRFVVNPPPNAVVVKTSWRDNPDFPDVLREEMERCKANNYKQYLHVWEGEPYSNYEESIIQPEWFDAAIDAHTKLGFRPMGLKVVGFDPADSGTDKKAMAYRQGSVVLNISQWSNGELPDAIDRVFSFCYDNRVNKLVYDSIGVGTGIKVGLADRLEGQKLEVEGFCGAEKTRNPKDRYEDDRTNENVFRNLRAQFYWHLRRRFEKTYHAVVNNVYCDPVELISLSKDIPELNSLRSELCRIQRKRGQNSFIQIESKEDMKARGMPSPNRADSLIYAFANTPPRESWKPSRQPQLAIA